MQKWKSASSSLLEANEILFRANNKQTILHAEGILNKNTKETRASSKRCSSKYKFYKLCTEVFPISLAIFFF